MAISDDSPLVKAAAVGERLVGLQRSLLKLSELLLSDIQAYSNDPERPTEDDLAFAEDLVSRLLNLHDRAGSDIDELASSIGQIERAV